jgi:drug/metabolite transporter (DMT)-like permease
MPESTAPRPWQLILAFGLLYVVWGSTYFAIRIAVRSSPPFALAGARFLVAGALPIGVMRLRGASWPSARQWRNAAIAGGCLMLGGNGLVSWAEQTVSSSLAALLIAVTPLWFVLLEALRPRGTRPSARGVLGLGLGFVGVAWLIGPQGMRKDLGSPPLFGIGLVMLACASWAFGSLFAKHSDKPASALMTSSLQMVCGGAELLALSLLAGESTQLAAASAPPAEAWLALAYLIVAGSWLGFGSYVWLLGRVSPEKLSTYAYVNPLVAVLLGVMFLDEPWSARLFGPALLILLGVLIVQLPAARR